MAQARLRRHTMVAREFAIGLRARDGWLGAWAQSALPTHDGQIIMALCVQR